VETVTRVRIPEQRRGDSFTNMVLDAVPGGTQGLYVGCGSGSVYEDLVAGGLSLTGLDVSNDALAALAARKPELVPRLRQGSLAWLPPGVRYDVVVGGQALRWGRREDAHASLRSAMRHVAPGGWFCCRVSVAGADLRVPHKLVDFDPADNSFTVVYTSGSKAGRMGHFFAPGALCAALSDEGFTPVRGPFLVQSQGYPSGGTWTQWEVVARWRSTHEEEDRN
jgi:SAM-dependent methyltransferase